MWIVCNTNNTKGNMALKFTVLKYMTPYRLIIYTPTHTWEGPNSVVGIATGYGLDEPRIKSRWGARFSAPVRTGPEAHRTSCTTGSGSFPGVKSGWGVTLTPHPLLVPWSRKSRAIPVPSHPMGRTACTRERQKRHNFSLFIYFNYE
jgi:hypothetical protein